MRLNRYVVQNPRPLSKLAAYLLHLHATEPDRLLGLRLSISARTYLLSRYRTVDISGEVIVTLHACDRWSDILTRSLHLL